MLRCVGTFQGSLHLCPAGRAATSRAVVLEKHQVYGLAAANQRVDEKNSGGKCGNKKKSTFSPGFRVSFCFLTSHRFSCQKHSIQPLVQQLPPHSRQVVKTSKAIIRLSEVALRVLHPLSHGSRVVVGLRGGSQDPCWEGRCTEVAPVPLPSLPAPRRCESSPCSCRDSLR